MTSSLLTITAVLLAAPLAAIGTAQPGLSIDDDNIKIRGCVTRAERYRPADRMPLVWSRNDIVVALADSRDSRAMPDSPAGRLFYWLDDEDLEDHIGQRVEIEGDLEDLEKGQIEIKRNDDFTTIELEFDGRHERARVPTPWFHTGRNGEEREYQVVVQKVDVDDVKVLGACNP